MKKLLLSIAVVATGFASQAQVVVAGVSPVSVQGNYEYSNQTHQGWPGEAGDGSWNLALDFNIPGTYVQDTLAFADDGSQGTNAQGNPISAEACNPLVNDLTSKIAVIYRNTCEFGTKAYNAEMAGAVAVIIINREDDLLGMLGGADGINVTIPVVMLSSVNGQILTDAMAQGPVEVFIGNKLGAFPNDAGAVPGEFLISPYGGANEDIFDGFDLGIQVYNYGQNDMPNLTVQATIDGPGGNVYDQTVAIPLNAGDTAFVFPGNATEFPTFNLGGVGNYPTGDYTLTYTIDGGVVEDFPFDNVFTSEFKVVTDMLSSSRLDASNMPVASGYPSNSTTEYQSCWMVQEPNIGGMLVDGIYIVPHADTTTDPLAGAEIFVNAYQWDDGWTDLNDPNYTFDPATNDAFQSLNLISFGTHYPQSDAETDQPAWVPFGTAFTMQDNVRYLFCAQTFESTTISFGYDGALDYGGNYGIFAQPVSPVHVDGQWYAAGWNGYSAPSMALHQTYVGLDEETVLEGNAFPNPANDVVTINVNANGAATLQITDIAGKVAFNGAVVLENGQTKVDISSLESGVYVFNVALENGETAQFNVVKK